MMFCFVSYDVPQHPTDLGRWLDDGFREVEARGHMIFHRSGTARRGFPVHV